jgi:hypothetical protein
MKYLVILFAFCLAFLNSIPKASAAAQQANGVRYLYTSGNIDGVNWTPVIASTVKAVKGISVLNTGAYVLEVGIGLAGAASSADVRQIVVPATANMSNPLYVPLSVGQGQRISIRSLASAGSIWTGELQLNAFYN